MLAAERQAKIVQEIQRRGAAKVADLVDLLGVSDMTIRRDLDVLAQQGLVDKVYGGATRRGRSTHEPGFEANRPGNERRRKPLPRSPPRRSRPVPQSGCQRAPQHGRSPGGCARFPI